MKTAGRLNTQAIFTDSHTGRTARVLAAFRGRKPVFAMTTSGRLARELALSYGVWAEYMPGKGIENTKESRRAYYTEAIKKMIAADMINMEDRVAYLGGSFGETGGTTYLDVSEVKKIIEAKDKYNLPDYTM